MKARLFSILFSGLLLASVSLAETAVPEFTVQVGHDPNAKMQSWLLNFLPPSGHHFNLEAPMKVTALSGQAEFIKVGATLQHVGYRLSDQRLTEGTEVSANLFLCDDALTYCIKKTLTFPLKVNSDLTALDFSVGKASKPGAAKNKTGGKDTHGFWNNDVASAISESLKTKKPILIDFYGIWCPPCNLYNETVYPTKKFQAAAKKWVLLKLDADQPSSFEVKSHFKVGGYPTTIAVKTPDAGKTETATLAEIDRIVGFYPVDEFLHLLDDAYTARTLSFDEKLASKKTSYLDALRQMIEVDLEKKEFKEAASLCDQGLAVSANDHYFALTKLSVHANEHAEVLKDQASIDLIKAIWTNREKELPETLMRMEDMLTTHSDQFTKPQIAWANDILDQLANEVKPETLSVPGVELSIADIDSMRTDVAKALSDPALEKQAFVKVVESYQKLIKLNHAETSRGYHIELAYALWKSGDIEAAKAMYSKFIALYPKEFTFYYAASKMYLELKDLKTAREDAENAVQYAYGDNKLRSMERLVRVMTAQGENTEALKRGKALLSDAPAVSPDLFIRTNRYVHALEKAVADAEKGKI